jgi:predicted transposase YbfD/YdcC
MVTIDAMGTQTKIAEQIIDQEGEYALALKDHHGNLYDEGKATFALAEKDGFPSQYWESDRQVEKGHGRLEIREHWTLSDPEILAYLDPEQNWNGLRGIGVVRGSAAYGAEDDERNALLPAQFFLSQNLCHCSQKPLGH